LTYPNNGRTVSWHIVVDEKEAIRGDTAQRGAWAAGDGANSPGNRTSIHIELCESGDYAKTLANAAELVASMLQERGWGVERLRRHWDWSGKVCPRLMFDDSRWIGWSTFCNIVRDQMRAKERGCFSFTD
jgi:N-acetylmuramoyl-L-alanine amidase